MKDELRLLLKNALSDRNKPVMNILRVLLGEINTQEARLNKSLEVESIYKIINKILQGINEMLQYRPGDAALLTEKQTLEGLLPRKLTKGEIMAELQEKSQEIFDSRSDGQATGIAMKLLKEKKLNVDGTEVSTVVQFKRKVESILRSCKDGVVTEELKELYNAPLRDLVDWSQFPSWSRPNDVTEGPHEG